LIVLAVDTATEICSVAFSRDEQIIGDCRLSIHRAHSERLLQLIKNISENINLKLEEIDLISISGGPGSFTGLRIGMATAKGLAFALQRPLIAIVTLEALAFQGAFHSGLICPVLKARTNEVYTALFENKTGADKPVLVADYRLLPLAALKDFVPTGSLLIGNGIIHYRAQIQNLLGNSVVFARELESQLSAAATAILGLRKYQEFQKDEAQFLEPFYIQEFTVKRPQPVATR
jgi:tRNA threonylcarbamoyladenosine biosynthesis protein TsaB